MGQIKNIKLHIVTDIKYKSSIASSATTMTVTASPLILWAQRADKVFVSVQLGDITNQEINLEKDKLSFKADAQGKKWETTIEFDGTVKPEESTQKNMGREYFFELCKTDPGPFWPRLTTTMIFPNSKVPTRAPKSTEMPKCHLRSTSGACETNHSEPCLTSDLTTWNGR